MTESASNKQEQQQQPQQILSDKDFALIATIMAQANAANKKEEKSFFEEIDYSIYKSVEYVSDGAKAHHKTAAVAFVFIGGLAMYGGYKLLSGSGSSTAGL